MSAKHLEEMARPPRLDARFGRARSRGGPWHAAGRPGPTALHPRGVKRVDDRRVLNGSFWHLRTGVPWADIPGRYGPHTTCVNRFNRWRRAGI
jgi:transposase